MIYKLLYRTFSPFQLLGYLLALIIGLALSISLIFISADLKSLFRQDTPIFDNNSIIVSKKVSVFKTFKPKKLYFSPKEVKLIKKQPFVQDFGTFKSSSFGVRAFLDYEQFANIFTDMFLESVPKRFIDVRTDNWTWSPKQEFVPIILPLQYLQLYNYGFAPSQGLPLISPTIAKQIPIKLLIWGNGRSQTFKAKIVAFSRKINTILVPEEFLDYANQNFARDQKPQISRLIIKISPQADKKKILRFFEKHNYDVDAQAIQMAKITTAVKFALGFLLALGFIVMLLAFFIIALSSKFILYKNYQTLKSLFCIGFNLRTLISFYVINIGLITTIGFIAAYIIAQNVRHRYLEILQRYFDFFPEEVNLVPLLALLLIALIGIYALIIILNFRRLLLPHLQKAKS